jgi:hypothetical protein
MSALEKIATGCCEELGQRLGQHSDGDLDPIPTYISAEDLASGRARAGWYPGATSPGFYNLSPETWRYSPMTRCPFCGQPPTVENI